MIVAVIAGLLYLKKQNMSFDGETADAERNYVGRNAQSVDEDVERKRKQEEFEAERARRKAAEDAEREKKRREREEQLRQRQEKAEAEKENRERVDDVIHRFMKAPIVFASDFKESNSPLKKDGSFYAIGVDYIAENKIYEAIVEQGAVSAVRVFSPKNLPEDVDVVTFVSQKLNGRLLLMDEDGVVWICGSGKSYWNEKVSLSDRAFMPAKVELKELYDVLSRWNRLPDLKYRLTLKPTTKSSDGISVGIIKYGACVDPAMMRDPVLKIMRQRQNRTVDIKPPKLEKFTPTVVFYDGDIIRKELKVTKVPRTFKHLGTKRYGTVKIATYNQAEQQWQALKAEAERQAYR